MRNFSDSQRVVIKIGTNLLTKDGKFNTGYVEEISSQIARLKERGLQVLLVSSGAIGMGAAELDLKTRVKDIKMRQACAAIGQPLLMHQYRDSFGGYGISIAQVLVTREVFSNRTTFLNLRNSVETLLSLGIIPIFNENDSVATDEIGSAFGDNDRLSAMIASKVDADLLIILTDIDGLYNSDPRKDSNASLISSVEEITDEILGFAGSEGSEFSTGGMKTKLQAVSIAANAGCKTILAHGNKNNILNRLLDGEEEGTVFLEGKKLSAKSRWILNSVPLGHINIDQGALEALRNKKSLLPSGVISVDGVFDEGEVISINGIANTVTKFTSTEIENLIGYHSKEIPNLVGKGRKDVIARAEDIIFL
ncbi:MAG: glutamate 5-kinase [Spirochaetia bacterium]|jgi:glutamate 5-kinase|nr:glutamate 5-kinase [Spirochaetia bacterium]